MQDLPRLIDAYVQELKRKGAIRSARVEQAFRRVKRHSLLERFYFWPQGGGTTDQGEPQEFQIDPEHPDPEALRLIYADNALVTRRDEQGRPTSSSSQPTLMAMMLEELALEPGMKVLEIGAGTGYNAALLAEIVGDPARVTTLDVQPEVVVQTERLLTRASYGALRVLCRDGALGDPERAPYDRIIATVGCSDLSWRWAEQLSPQGQMLIPLQHGGLTCAPSVKLAKVKGQSDHLTGRVAHWSGFMHIQGELDARSLWTPVEYQQRPSEERPPDRVYPLFSALERTGLDTASYEAGRRAWWDFHYFLALCDRRAYLRADAIGLADPGDLGMIALTEEGIKLWGDEALYLDLEHVYRRWERLERPRLTDWQIELLPQERVPDLAASDEEKVWLLDRPHSRQKVRLP